MHRKIMLGFFLGREVGIFIMCKSFFKESADLLSPCSRPKLRVSSPIFQLNKLNQLGSQPFSELVGIRGVLGRAVDRSDLDLLPFGDKVGIKLLSPLPG